MNEKPVDKPKPITVTFRDSAPFLGEAQSATVGSKGVTGIEPGIITSKGIRAADASERCDGLLVRYVARNDRGEMVPKSCLVPLHNIRGLAE